MTFSGTSVSVLSRIWATTPLSVSPTAFDPTDGHAAVGDVGVLVQPAAGHEIGGDVVGTDAQRGRHMQVETPRSRSTVSTVTTAKIGQLKVA